MNYNFDAELQKKMSTGAPYTGNCIYFNKPFAEKPGWRFIYGKNRDFLIYVRPTDGRHKFGVDFKELAQINNFEKARDLILSRTKPKPV